MASPFLDKMIGRLLGAMASGPNLNCRPHSSRQRVDLAQLARLGDLSPETVLETLLGEEASVRVTGRISAPPPRVRFNGRSDSADDADENLTDQERQARRAWSDQQSLLTKLRHIAEDARTYEQDTGVHVLHIGFPLLSLPPGVRAAGRTAGTRRVLAPIAFIPVTLDVVQGAATSMTLACRAEGVDRVVPNEALLAWLDPKGSRDAEMFAEDDGAEPWREIRAIVAYVAGLLEISPPDFLREDQQATSGGAENAASRFTLMAAPRADDDNGTPRILLSAVLGLYPASNQGILRDVQAMADGEPVEGPVESFLRSDASLAAGEPQADGEVTRRVRVFADERPVTLADPCQARAVRLARAAPVLVVHGPPGTGKSQTIANIIGDHLSRDQRVLFVCDKRTAIDVVADRLEHMGLGELCAVVHDPQRDQRELYRAIRDQLDRLPDTKPSKRAGVALDRVDEELQRLHDELARHRAALMEPNGGPHSLHELIGRWLAIRPDPQLRLDDSAVVRLDLATCETHVAPVRETLGRALDSRYVKSSWRSCAELGVSEYLARPADDWRRVLIDCQKAARALDETVDSRIPALSEPDVESQAQERVKVADRLERVGRVDPAIRARWANASSTELDQAVAQFKPYAQAFEVLRAGPLDPELALVAADQRHTLTELNRQIAALSRYLPIADKWYAFLCFGRRSAAAKILASYALPPGQASAERLRQFLEGLRARVLLSTLYRQLSNLPADTEPLDHATLEVGLNGHNAVLYLLHVVRRSSVLSSLADRVAEALTDDAKRAELVEGLRRSVRRAQAIAQFDQTVAAAGMFSSAARSEWNAAARRGERLAPIFDELVETLPRLEGILRTRATLDRLPENLRPAVAALVEQQAGSDPAWQVLTRAALANEITRRLQASPELHAMDEQRTAAVFARIRELEDQKRELVRQQILDIWTTRQRDRLLVGTGSRLNSMGADLRRRLLLRGKRALRLRQVLHLGEQIEGGDPLFDLRPVWMASPETVAQIFPRRPCFDVLIFDEASQCRLEEALPVLLRGRRVVIAGDPRQLPPTRFFESAVVVSEEEEVETEQQLFEMQQGEIEDLLGAALNLPIEQAYLDVHYRSRNADLIEFSNAHFYGHRLQAIPGHPSHRPELPPLRLHRVNGVYEERCNRAEADAVCGILRELLSRPQPPSVGIACFNVAQRDLILDRLNELASEDDEFARLLAVARSRRGHGASESLFVKNLENVQGDERDHIIISTTYGPDPKGRFYRRFGPLGAAGGGRRLNVLVTRAREEVHLVTSIPPEQYRSLPPVPEGQTPGGGWLLMAYIQYAEQLAKVYAERDGEADVDGAARPAQVRVRPSRYPSVFAEALAHRLAAEYGLGGEVHWGNDGFCVDVALQHPQRADDVSIGLLCDSSRFAQAEDLVDWDIFRTSIHESQGWQLRRIWSPQVFRDPEGTLRLIAAQAREVAASARRNGSPH